MILKDYWISLVKRRRLFLPFISTSIFYVIFHTVIRRLYFFDALNFNLLPDFLIQLFFAYVFFSFSRKTYLFLIEQAIFMGIIFIGHALKCRFFGAPFTIDDFYSFLELCFVIDKLQVFFMVAPILSLITIFLINFKIRKVASCVSFVLLLIIPTLLVFNSQAFTKSIESHFNYWRWDELHNLNKSGGSLYLVYRGLKFLEDRPKPPDSDSVHSALAELSINYETIAKNFVLGEDFKPRNTYLILMESLWDPLLLKKIAFSDDPWDYEFRKIWDETKNSKVITPAFGGGTANPEFELLTGHPANLYGSKIMFKSGIINHIPALPALLSRYGYETYAFHPNIAGFWNRDNIYYRFGFEYYFSENSFMLNDLNGAFLSNESLYKQAYWMAHKSVANKPKFVYILTYTGHPPFRLNKTKRPSYIKSNSAIKDLERYANVLKYCTKETVDFIKVIKKDDPDALIVIAGDHLPILGEKFSAFKAGGLLEDSLDKFTADMYLDYSATPLIIIDGKKGPLNVGTIALYELPGIILRLLNFPDFTSIDLFRPPDNLHVRVFPGLSLIIQEGESAQLCKRGDENKLCSRVSRWIENIKIIDSDILFGKQISIKELSENRGFIEKNEPGF